MLRVCACACACEPAAGAGAGQLLLRVLREAEAESTLVAVTRWCVPLPDCIHCYVPVCQTARALPANVEVCAAQPRWE